MENPKHTRKVDFVLCVVFKWIMLWIAYRSDSHSKYLLIRTVLHLGSSSGQLGRGSPAQQFHPVPIAVPLAMPVAMVACGGDHSLLVTTCRGEFFEITFKVPF